MSTAQDRGTGRRNAAVAIAVLSPLGALACWLWTVAIPGASDAPKVADDARGAAPRAPRRAVDLSDDAHGADADHADAESLVVAVPPEDPRSVEPRGALRGVVLDPDGRPAGGARVWVFPAHVIFVDGYGTPQDYQHIRYEARSATTGADGRWSLPEVGMGGRYGVRAESAAYGESSRSDVFVADEQPVDVPDLAFARRCAVTVTVLRPDGTPDEDALVQVSTVSAWLRDDDAWLRGRRFEALRPGRLCVLALCPPFPVAREAIVLSPGEDRAVTVRMREGGIVLAGRVVDDSGAPIAGAHVSARESSAFHRSIVHPEDRWTEGPSEATALSDANGAFSLPGLLEGFHDIRVEAPEHFGARLYEQRLPVDPLRVEIVRTARAAVRLVAPGGRPAPSVVRVETQRHRPFQRHIANEGWDGVGAIDVHWSGQPLTIRAIPPGRGRLRISADGFAPQFAEFTVEPGACVDLGTVGLEASPTIRGRVVDPRGKPVSGAGVSTADRTARTATAADGTFQLANLAHGPVRIVAEAHGFLSASADTIADGAEPVVVSLPRAAIFRGRVLNSLGEPVPEANVMLFAIAPDGSTSATGDVYADHRGVFERAIPPGRYALGRYDPSNFRPPADTPVVELRAGETTWHVIRR